MRLWLLPESFILLLNAAIIAAQRREIVINSVLSLTPQSLPNPPVFTIPASARLALTVALCASVDNPPRFFVTNSSANADTPTSGSVLNGNEVYEIGIENGLGVFEGPFGDGGILAVENVGQMNFELGLTDSGASLIFEYSVASNKVTRFNTSSAKGLTSPW